MDAEKKKRDAAIAAKKLALKKAEEARIADEYKQKQQFLEAAEAEKKE
jgi:hypothetical protein